MLVDRALVSRAIQVGGIATVMAHGVAPYHFNRKTPDGDECATVLEWAYSFIKRFNVAPSLQIFREQFPDFQMEPTSDPLEALITLFFNHVKRRAFSAKVSELAKAEGDPSKWGELDRLLASAAQDMADLIPSGRISRFSDMRQRINQYEEEAANPDLRKGWNFGIAPFDELTNGMRPGNVVTIAGASGKGKSLLSQFALMSTYEQDATGLLISLEMTAEEIFERLDTMVMNFSHKLLSQRRLPEEDIALWRRIANQYAGTHNDLIVVDKAFGCTTDRVYAEINRFKPDVVVVDYVQLMKTHERYASQWQALTEITNELKSIALATDSVIVMASQDGRDSFKNGSQEDNSGGSISVYQAADIYIGLHQTDEMYDNEQMEVRLLKNRRGGRMKHALLKWKLETMEIGFEPDPAPKSADFQRTIRADQYRAPEPVAA